MAEIVEDRRDRRPAFGLGSAILYIAYIFTTIAGILLLLRIILELFRANSGSPFVDFIYRTSGDLMLPFRGIFPTQTIGNGFVLDISAIFALFVYLIILYLIQSLIDSVEYRRVHRV